MPGAIDAPASAGCLAFLREFPERRRIVAGIPQLIDDLGLADHLAEPGVSTDAAATLSRRRRRRGATRPGDWSLGRATVDELVAATGWPVATVLAALTLLERRGLAVGVHGRFRPAGGLAAADPATARQRPRRARLLARGPAQVETEEPAGFARAFDRCYPHRGRPPPERPEPRLGASPDNEQERLLRQAAIALLAVPILFVVYLGALLRRSTLARAGFALGLAFVLGIGVLRPVARRPRSPRRQRRSCRSTQAAFTTAFVDRPRTDRARDDQVQRADGSGVGRRGPQVEPPTTSTRAGTPPAPS